MTEGAKYTDFGNYMFQVANENKSQRGPYRVARFMEEEARRRGYDLGESGEPRQLPRGGAVSKYFLGRSYPPPWWVMAFADLFDLNKEQRQELAERYAYKASYKS
jgi:hypothetical protein